MTIDSDAVIKFQAQTFKVQTLQAGGWRLTLDGWDLSIIGLLAKTQQPGIILEVAAIAIDKKADDDDLNLKL